jgi:hypothetical protein
MHVELLVEVTGGLLYRSMFQRYVSLNDRSMIAFIRRIAQ